MITQREVLVALLEGRVVSTSDHSYRMEGDNWMFRYKDLPWKHLGYLENVIEISDPYPLTFQEAYKAMKDGKKVARSSDPGIYYYITEHHLPGVDVERIYFKPIDGSGPGKMAHINIGALDDMWEVVG